MSIGRAHTVSLFWLSNHDNQDRFGILESQRNFQAQLFYALMDLGFYAHNFLFFYSFLACVMAFIKQSKTQSECKIRQLKDTTPWLHNYIQSIFTGLYSASV